MRLTGSDLAGDHRTHGVVHDDIHVGDFIELDAVLLEPDAHVDLREAAFDGNRRGDVAQLQPGVVPVATR